MSVTEQDIINEFNRIEGKSGVYKMMIGEGEEIIYNKGKWETYFNLENVSDVHPEEKDKESCLRIACERAIGMSDNLFSGFEKYDEAWW